MNAPVNTITLVGRKYEVHVAQTGLYGDGTPAVQLIDAREFETVATATVCMMGHGIAPAEGCVFIKDYSENEGLADQLVKLGMIEPTGRVEQAGWTVVAEYRILRIPAATAAD